MRNKLVLVLALFTLWYFFVREEVVTTAPGVLAPEQPRQHSLAQAAAIRKEQYQITPLASFTIKARVLARKNYRFGREADLSPVDFALGWGRMSDQAVLAAIEISQSNRWYHWRTDNFPIPRREIETSSANMHLIPADGVVANQLDRVRQGDVVELRGKLVAVTAPDGWRWQSSLSRDDTGNGSCEVVWVEDVLLSP